MSDKPSLGGKLITQLQKAKDIDEMIIAFNSLEAFYHQQIEDHRKKLIEKANQLPKNNNGG